MEIYNKIKEALANAEADAVKFYENGNAAAGARLRKAAQDVKKLAQELRVDVQTKKNAAK